MALAAERSYGIINVNNDYYYCYYYDRLMLLLLLLLMMMMIVFASIRRSCNAAELPHYPW